MKPVKSTASLAPKVSGLTIVTPETATSAKTHVLVPSAKKAKEVPLTPPPDEETLQRLNAMAKQYPFCIRHKGRNNTLL